MGEIQRLCWPAPLGARGAGILGAQMVLRSRKIKLFLTPCAIKLNRRPEGRFPRPMRGMRPPWASFSGQIQADGTMFRRVRDVASGRRLSRLLRLSHRKAFPLLAGRTKPNTASPSAISLTPSPTTLSVPEKSRPGTKGNFVCSYSPRRTFQSAALTLVAAIDDNFARTGGRIG